MANFITVDNPNIPVLSHNKPQHIEYGRFTETAIENFGEVNGSVVRLKDMYLPNFSLRAIEAQFNENVAFYNTHAHGSELLGTCVFFQARMKSIEPSGKETVIMSHRTHNFKYDPFNEYIHLSLAGSPLNFVHFSYTTEYLNEILPHEETWAEVLKERVNRKERIMGNRPLPINLIQERALENIFNCPLEGRLGLMMIETSIVQLILLQLHSLFAQEPTLRPNVSRQDTTVVHDVREYITQHFLQDHSITGLARQFGLNTNKLMYLFKTTFGTSVFEYLGSLRMDYARQLLLDNKHLRVVDIARTLGYKNPNHFSAAFKKRYGTAPSELK